MAEPTHETTDVKARTLIPWAVGLLLALGILLVIVRWGFNYAQIQEGSRLKSLPESTFRLEPGSEAASSEAAFPKPLLQVTPAEDLSNLQAAEVEVLNSYGWVDKKKKIVRIPIAKAMDLLLQKGLPVRRSER